MTTASTQFTDRNLMIFYGHVLQHYKNRTTHTIDAIYSELFQGVQFALESPHGTLYNLNPEGKEKVYHSFDAIFYALPINNPTQSRPNRSDQIPFNYSTRYVINQHNHYRCHDSYLFDWLLLNSLTHNCHHHHRNHQHSHPIGRRWGESTHQHPTRNKKDNSDYIKALAAIAVVLLAAAAAILTAIALYYMLNEFLEGVDRFCYNEGWLNAALVMANSVVFGMGANIITYAFAAAPLAALAVLAGLNPIGVVTIAAVLLSTIGAGIGAFAMNLLYKSTEKKLNPDSMDPADPLRFRLTLTEEQHLVKKGFDPITVKCALVALRAELAQALGDSKKSIPTYLNRLFNNDTKTSELLQKVRDLRRGTIDKLHVGELTFDCKPTIIAAQADHFVEPTIINDAEYDALPHPSAPPAQANFK